MTVLPVYDANTGLPARTEGGLPKRTTTCKITHCRYQVDFDFLGGSCNCEDGSNHGGASTWHIMSYEDYPIAGGCYWQYRDPVTGLWITLNAGFVGIIRLTMTCGPYGRALFSGNVDDADFDQLGTTVFTNTNGYAGCDNTSTAVVTAE